LESFSDCFGIRVLCDPERVYPLRRCKCLDVALLVNTNSKIIWNWKNNSRSRGLNY
jgi:hypothetical protein